MLTRFDKADIIGPMQTTSKTATTTEFKKLILPDGQPRAMPADITVKFPVQTTVAVNRLHLLAYIPWDDNYSACVPAAYRDFFRHALPHLGVRTSDVHTALSVSHVPELIALSPQPLNEALLHLAVILHDCGWSKLGEEDVANSLDYSALAYSDQALRPKEQHATLGANLSRQLLDSYQGSELRMATEHAALIADIVHYHDAVRLWDDTRLGAAPAEYWLVVDADRLWSYTHENFWLDTIRKNTPAPDYARHLAANLEDYFLTEPGKIIARRLMAERQAEVANLAIS
ncbi:MAG: metal-dependent phosphohydrolase [Patescibacteria group bacterium]|nr:metal-dependent phosphohydrolase [Patescibacteria group bacterium]